MPEDKPAGKEQPFRIDFEGLPYRILDLPIAAGRDSEPAGGHRRADLLPEDG